MTIWNPWHGCTKISPGCAHCYVYRRDASFGKDSSRAVRTADYDLPLRRERSGAYRLRPEDGTVYTCMTSDFFLDQADTWRGGCWDMIRVRRDLHFYIITKRIARFHDCVPPDWGDGWENVTICATCEDQQRADERIPLLLASPIRHREIICEPMLGPVDLSQYLKVPPEGGGIEHVTCGGESGPDARPLEFSWVRDLRTDCVRAGVPFTFQQTGADFRMNGKVYRIGREDQMIQAEKSGMNYTPGRNDGAKIRYVRPAPEALRSALAKSPFRSRFHLSPAERDYFLKKGPDVIEQHARDFVASRLAPENPQKDGKQTPMRGHPVFKAQHATACCCRRCLEKWHHIPSGKELTEEEQDYIVRVLMDWIRREMA